MKMIKKIPLVLVISGCLFFVCSNVFADDLFPEDEATITDTQQRMAYKHARGEAQRIRAQSKRPEIVGEEILEQEADGQFTLSQEALDNWSNGRMFPVREQVNPQ
jgi:hypothetical protein